MEGVVAQVPQAYEGWLPDPSLLETTDGLEVRLILTPLSSREPTVYIDQYGASSQPADLQDGIDWGANGNPERSNRVNVNGRLTTIRTRELLDVEPMTWVARFEASRVYYEVTVAAGSDAITTSDVEAMLARLFPQ